MSITFVPDATSGQTSETRRTFQNSQLTSDDFLQLMIQELVHQDPLNPMKNEQLLAQVSQIKNMETLTRLDQTMSTMNMQQSVASASGLIGRKVSGVSTNSENVTGVVERIMIGSKIGVVVVTSAGDAIPVGSVTDIEEAA